MRRYGVPIAAVAAAALAVAGLAMLARADAGPMVPPPPAETASATASPAHASVATPEATSTHAAAAAPAETGAGSSPVPGASLTACSNGVAVPASDPAAYPELVRDCALLLDAKDALRGGAALDWSAGVSMADWEGVRLGVPGSGGPVRVTGPARVTGLDLRDKGLTGVISPRLGYLTGLTSLDLAGNALTGAIPPELANLTALEQFLAGGNRLTGGIPAGFGTPDEPRRFFAGDHPARDHPARFGLPRELHTLDLSGNRLTGTIPDLSRLTKLRRLDLRGNRLAGGIPAWLGDARDLAVLRLDGNRLSGPIPRGIGRLPQLSEVALAGNALTGCVPSPLEDASGDAAGLGLPWCLRYDRLDAAGEAAESGEWAILGGNGEVLTTWEGLRSGAATLRVHQTDAGGTSWATEFGAVAAGDLFEWRKADDCWVRYRVTGAPVAPTGSSGRWEFPIEWMTYAATGAGCTGAVGAGAVLRVDEDVPAALSALTITAPVRHGAFLVFPRSWDGEVEAQTRYEPPPLDAEGAAGAAAPITRGRTESLAEARRFRYWRDPVLPAGWTLRSATIGRVSAPMGGYRAVYFNEDGYLGAEIDMGYAVFRPAHQIAIQLGGSVVVEPRVIDGLPALVQYQPRGGDRRVQVMIFDPETEMRYVVRGYDFRLSGSNDEAVIAIARSLLPATTP